MIRSDLKVGQLARLAFETFLKDPDPAEFERLQEGEYCSNTFGLPPSLPVLKKEDDILNAPSGSRVGESYFLNRNYWSKRYLVNGVWYRVVNDWHERKNAIDNRPPLEKWINAHGLKLEGEIVPLSDYEVQTITSSSGESWYRQIVVDDVQKLRLILSSSYDSNVGGTWIFRGQGDAQWMLETSLGRVAYSERVKTGYGSALKAYERKSMWMFGRDASKDLEYRDFEGLNLLSLMQHYGCKTRLLDFSLSPLVAMFVAIDQYETNMRCVKGYFKINGTRTNVELKKPSLALWAVNLDAFCEPGPDEGWEDQVKRAFYEADDVVVLDKDSEDLGVKVVFPTICNRRISAQDGLFLMPTSLDYAFEENLCKTLGMGSERFHEQPLSKLSDLRSHLPDPIIKFVVRPEKVGEIKQVLRDANVTARTVYPDLTGLGKYVGSMSIELHQ